MILAALDDSGKKDGRSHYICLVGYLAEDAQWDDLSAAWSALLLKHHIPYLHTADFLGGYKVPYKGLGLTPDGRRAIAREFLDEAHKHLPIGISVAVNVRDYDNIDKAYRKVLGKTPHIFCFHRVLRCVADTLAMRQYVEPVPIMFDDDMTRSSRHYQEWSELRRTHPEFERLTAAITFADDRHYHPLQAADVFANTTHRNLQEGTKASATPMSGVRGECWGIADLENAARELLGQAPRSSARR